MYIILREYVIYKNSHKPKCNLKYLICTLLSTYLDMEMTITTQLLDESEAHYLVISNSRECPGVKLNLQAIIMLVSSSIQTDCTANSARSIWHAV